MNNKFPLISIIVPVYNAEKYLDRCIKSLFEQTYKNIEIVLVDDGSTDGSLSKCEFYKEKDKRVKVIHKENGGLSSARNVGLNYCEGQYISFVDSDDSIDFHFIERAIEYINKYDVDIVCFSLNFLAMNANPKRKKNVSDKKNQIILNNEELMIELAKFKNVTNSVCDKVFKKTLFEKIRFKEGLYYEDTHCIHYLFSKCDKAAVLNEKLYNYYMTKNSITRKKYFHPLLDYIEAINDRLNFYRNNYPHIEDYLIENYLEVCLFVLVRLKIGKTFNKEITKIENDLLRLKDQKREVIEKITNKKIRLFFSNKSLFYCKYILLFFVDKIYINTIFLLK